MIECFHDLASGKLDQSDRKNQNHEAAQNCCNKPVLASSTRMKIMLAVQGHFQITRGHAGTLSSGNLKTASTASPAKSANR